MDNSDLKIFQYEFNKLMEKYDINEYILLAENDGSMINNVQIKQSDFLVSMNDAIEYIMSINFKKSTVIK